MRKLFIITLLLGCFLVSFYAATIVMCYTDPQFNLWSEEEF